MLRRLPLSQHLPVYRDVWRLALPVIATNLLTTLVNIVDVFMVGRLGPTEIAAVGMAGAVRLVVLVVILSVTAGSMALAAQAKGARDPTRLSFVTRQSLSLTVLVSVVLSVAGYSIAEPVMGFLNGDGDPRAAELGAGYLQLLFLGTVLLTLNFAARSLMQGAGDTVTPLYLSGAVNLLNILFNYLFIFGPGPLPALGVTGAALGTLAARFLGAVASLVIFYSGRNVITLLPGSYRPDWKMFGDILRIGVPSGLQGLVRTTAQLLVIRIVTATPAGTFGAAALAIGLQIESLAFMPGLAINIAATSLVGQSLGAWQTKEATMRGNAAIGLGVLVMCAIGVPLFIFAPQLVLLFDPSAQPTVIAAGTSYLRVNAFGLATLAVAMVTNGALRGAGDTRPGLIGNLLGRWLTVVPLAYLLALTFGFGVIGVWLALVVGTAVSGAYVLLRWRSKKWLEIALKGSDIYRAHLHALPEDERRRFLDTVKAPLMALDGATEQIDEWGVTYRTAAGEMSLTFTGQSFHIAKNSLTTQPLKQAAD